MSAPTQTCVPPVITEGSGFTVTPRVTRQPVANEYVIVTLPAVNPETRPVDDPTVATTVLLLVQVPPPGSDSASTCPTQTEVLPVITPGSGFTVSTVNVEQPVGSVYEMTEVPGPVPVSKPEPEPIVATDPEPLVQLPPGDVSLSIVELPWHTNGAPVMGAGTGLTLSAIDVKQPVGKEYEILVTPAEFP